MGIYTDNKQHIDQQYKDIKERNRRAKELRAQGWTVTCKKWDFTDLARAVVYSLEATR